MWTKRICWLGRDVHRAEESAQAVVPDDVGELGRVGRGEEV